MAEAKMAYYLYNQLINICLYDTYIWGPKWEFSSYSEKTHVHTNPLWHMQGSA